MTIQIKNEQNHRINTSDSWVQDEARRCLSCFDPPCQRACPVSIPIPEFIRAITTGNTRRAAAIIRDANPLASICGKVCPEEVFCQSCCTRSSIDSPLMIRELHSWATSFEKQSAISSKAEATVAIIGGGPAGISCAIKLKEAGIDSIIFESTSFIGGVPRNSIPGFRLADKVIDKDVNRLRELGIEIKNNSVVSNPVELLGSYKAVLIAAGLPICRRLEIPGEDCDEVMSSLEFLEQARVGKLRDISGKRVVIIGGGNVSLDAASVAAELGASEVRLIYRRGPNEMKVWESERREAAHRGVVIEYLLSPKEFVIKDSILTGVRCIQTSLDEKLDSTGRRIVHEILGTEHTIAADLAIVAVGMTSNYLGDIQVNSDLTTSHQGLFIAGDLAHGEGTIVEAVADGKAVARKIIEYIEKGR
jgi:dihydropyrimidine dehydrogenase (NAD+) subunit PreT